MVAVQTTSLMERALLLRGLPPFDAMRTEHVVALARGADECTLRRGAVVQAARQPVRTLQVLVDGGLRITHRGGGVERVEAPCALGLLDLLAGQPAAATVAADVPATLLVIDGRRWWDALEDDFALLVHVRALLGRALAWHAAAHGGCDLLGDAPHALEDPGTSPADMIGQLLHLRRVPLLRAFGVAVLGALLRDHPAAHQVPAGDCLLRAGAPAQRLLMIAAGAAECRPAGGGAAHPVGAGVLLGENAALAGLPVAHDVVALSPVTTIAIDAQRLWDVAEDHAHVARALLAHAAGRVRAIDAPPWPARVARSGGDAGAVA